MTKKPAKNAKSKSASVKTAGAKKENPKSKPWGRRCPYDATAALDDRGREIANQYDDLAIEIEELEQQIDFKKSCLPILQQQIEAYVARVKEESRFEPALPKIFDESIGFYLRCRKTNWAKLAESGAADSELLKLLSGPKTYYAPGHRYRLRQTVNKQLAIYHDRLHAEDVDIVVGNAAVIAEVRRIMQIPQPVEKAGAGKKKPASKGKPRASATGTKSNAQQKAKSGGSRAQGQKKGSPRAAAQPAPEIDSSLGVAPSEDMLRDPHTDPHRVDQALELIDANRQGYYALKKRLRKEPTVSQILKHLGSEGQRPRIKEPASGYSPADYERATALRQERREEFDALAKELGGPPNPQEVLVYLGDAGKAPGRPSDEGARADGSPGALENIVAHAKGKLPDASRAKRPSARNLKVAQVLKDIGVHDCPALKNDDAGFDLATYEAELLESDALADGDVTRPRQAAQNGVHPGPQTVTIQAPKLGAKNSRRKANGRKLVEAGA